MTKPKTPKFFLPKAISCISEMRIPNGEPTDAQIIAWWNKFVQTHGCTPIERIAELEAEIAQLEAELAEGGAA